MKALKNNINRVQKYVGNFVGIGDFLQSCFSWKSKIRSIVAFIVRCVTLLRNLSIVRQSAWSDERIKLKLHNMNYKIGLGNRSKDLRIVMSKSRPGSGSINYC